MRHIESVYHFLHHNSNIGDQATEEPELLNVTVMQPRNFFFEFAQNLEMCTTELEIQAFLQFTIFFWHIFAP